MRGAMNQEQGIVRMAMKEWSRGSIGEDARALGSLRSD